MAQPVVQIPVLLVEAAPHVALADRSFWVLHEMCRTTAAAELGLDLRSDRGRSQARLVADLMVEALAVYLVDRGQHPHPDAGRTVADWLLTEQPRVVCAEFRHAAAWWAGQSAPHLRRVS